MARIDKQKEKVVNYRMIWLLSITSLLGLISFIFNRYDELNFLKQIFIIFTGGFLVIVVLYLTLKLKNETDKLEEL